MFQESFPSSRPVDATHDPYARVSKPSSAVSHPKHEQQLRAAWTSMASSAGAIVLGVAWLAAGYYFGRIHVYPFFLIGGGAIGVVSSLAYFARLS